jgi:hypothetical protein
LEAEVAQLQQKTAAIEQETNNKNTTIKVGVMLGAQCNPPSSPL